MIQKLDTMYYKDGFYKYRCSKCASFVEIKAENYIGGKETTCANCDNKIVMEGYQHGK